MNIDHEVSAEIFRDDMRKEYLTARRKHDEMHSLHEGLAILWEEFEEVKKEVFKKHPDGRKVYDELVQVATMAMAMAVEAI